jgi:hypothetical protein
MAFIHQLRRLVSAVLIGCGIAFGALSAPIVLGALAPAAAQISEDAQIALEQYGSWRPHPRFGDVWVPADVPPDWRPYAYGHWVYTDEWGWYWVSDDVEADWGWVVYHYGRWAFERGFGWFWVPGEEWAPAWVDWRYGDDYSGWAPLPPEELIEAYEVEPAYWVFVPTRFIAAPRLRTYFVPVQRRSVILRSTHIVNRTFPVRGARLAVNPGISPAFVARVSGAPVATYRVRPRVFASTQGVAGAVPIRREELRGARGGRPAGPGGPGRPGGSGAPARLGAISVQRTTAVIQPNAAVTAPQPLEKNEPGRLGTHPPRAAQGVAPTPSVAPLQPQPPSNTPPPPPKPAGPTPPPGSGLRSGPPPTTTAPITTAPTTAAPTTTPSTTPPGGAAPAQQLERREERRDLRPPGGAGGGAPPAVQQGPQPQPNIVRPIPPQTPPPPPPPPPQQRQVQPPPPPPPPQQRQVQPPPPPPPPQQRQVQPPPPPPPAARAPAPPPPPPRQAPPPKKPPPKPGEEPPK